jgi:hypothetical protein
MRAPWAVAVPGVAAAATPSQPGILPVTRLLDGK